MALDIVTQDIIIDETPGLTDDDVNKSVAPHSTNTTLQYLLSRDGAGGLTSPEVAFQTNFVVASASAGETINSVVLTQSASGTPFSTTVGVNSNIRTADGNYVWLFQDPTHANVVIGVIGTSNPAVAPAANGPLAFSLGLVSTSATNADLYTVQYVPLFQPDATNADDRIDLTDKYSPRSRGRPWSISASLVTPLLDTTIGISSTPTSRARRRSLSRLTTMARKLKSTSARKAWVSHPRRALWP
ncbi:hypothetical protein AJ88_10955 [Mesorhizobium amorphae CCBAU 01583]|nr:hypothetical protein AJ88_10955 [Mesorhizobium amorphae CCBAU 01583]